MRQTKDVRSLTLSDTWASSERVISAWAGGNGVSGAHRRFIFDVKSGRSRPQGRIVCPRRKMMTYQDNRPDLLW